MHMLSEKVRRTSSSNKCNPSSATEGGVHLAIWTIRQKPPHWRSNNRATWDNNNNNKCKELGWICFPMVVEAYSAWGTEAMESFSLLASRLATSSNRAKAEVLAAFYGRLNLNLVRANATAILSRCFVPE